MPGIKNLLSNFNYEKKEGKLLKKKLITAVKKVLAANNAILNTKIEKALDKYAARLVKKSSKKQAGEKSTALAKKIAI